tara:strand:+ start:258 stop:695 length:438 start_codon:yes stop_codon:yes gene_type:complete
MIKGNIIVESSKWLKKIKSPNQYFKKKISKLNKLLKQKQKKELSILLTNNKNLKKLNFRFRKKNKPTDVLSFPSAERNYIGDIAISYEFVNKKSSLSNFNYELDRLWIHGYLHLIGYDHKKNKDYFKMIKKENLLVNKLNPGDKK